MKGTCFFCEKELTAVPVVYKSGNQYFNICGDCYYSDNYKDLKNRLKHDKINSTNDNKTEEKNNDKSRDNQFREREQSNE